MELVPKFSSKVNVSNITHQKANLEDLAEKGYLLRVDGTVWYFS
jgi:hypothetical protein